MNSKFFEALGITPGPWHTHDLDHLCCCGFIFEEYKLGAVAKCQHAKPDNEYASEYPTELKMRHNALLIATAPEMLEALIKLALIVYDEPCRYDHHGYCQSHFVEKNCTIAYAVNTIEKATGRTWKEVKQIWEDSSNEK